MADSAFITANIVDGATIEGNVTNGVTINTNVSTGTSVTANVVTGGKGDKGDTGATGSQGLTGLTGVTGSTGAIGATGAAGTNGTNGTAATITAGTASALSVGSSPTVTNSGSSSAAVFNFGIPTGATGATGTTGSQGIQGIQGNTGATGSTGATGTAATISVGTVTTGIPGSSVSVTNSGTTAAAIFDIAIPQGATGASGSGTGDMLSTNNLSDVTNTTTARTNLGLGSLATQSGTFSGTSSGTNTGDQNLSGYELLTNKQTNLTASATKYPTVDAVNTGLATKQASGTYSTDIHSNITALNLVSGTNTGDQTNISGNAATVTTNANLIGDITSTGNTTTYANAVPVAIGGTGTTTTTGSGANVLGTTPTLATPVINGLPTGTGVSSASTASTLVSRDANKNIVANNLQEAYATTATAAGTTTLTVASAGQQFLTGTSTQIVKLPVTSTLALGFDFIISNNSTGLVTVNSSGSNTVLILAGGTSATFTCILTSGTTAASWAYAYVGNVGASGKKLTSNNTLTLAGTDGTTLTMPAATDTLVGRASTDTLTNKTIDAAGTGNLITNVANLSVKRQNDTTNSTVTGARIETGWGQVTGAGASGVVNENVSFNSAFASAPVVYVSYLNAKTVSDATSIDQFNSGNEDTTVSTSSISASGFTIRMYKPSVFGSGTRFGYAWIAIGA